jgi:hypothetical protein
MLYNAVKSLISLFPVKFGGNYPPSFSVDSIRATLKKMPNGKSPGQDGIFVEMLKVDADLSWRTYTAIITPVHKAKGDLSLIAQLSTYSPNRNSASSL